MSEYLFEMRNIVKEFSGVRALNGINLAVRPGECVGLCGENGAGKSTLMKVLSGVYPYGTWEGEILFDGKPLKAHSVRDSENAGVVIIHQELMLVPQLSVAENIFLGNEIRKFGGVMDYDAMYAQADALLARLKLKDVNVAAPVMNYGGGYQQLFEIAKALVKNARLLILDEPSSSLTSSETDTLLSIIEDLKRDGVACVYISHKLDEVARVCDTVTVIRDGKHIVTKPMSEMTTHSIITAMVGREIENLFPKMDHEIGEVIFEAKHVTCWDVANPNRKRVDDISFQVRRGEIVGIAGLVGAGRTELVSAIFGAYPGRSEAELILEGKPIKVKNPEQAIKAGLSLVPEDRKRQGIVPLLGVGDNITLATLSHFAHAGQIDRQAEMQVVDAEIKRLRVKTASPELAIQGLSGGNQQKAVLTKMLLPQPKVLILDEPTRGVDVGSKYDIYTLMFELAAKGVAIIMVSSEMPEVLGVSDRVLVVGEGKLRGDFKNVGLTSEQVLAAAISHAAEGPAHAA
ncbi:xylose ABC transporter ATP-binding protein [Luteibacter pinisoli]|uniref:Xylose ABC transporter ATP-binding protein n=1 Tax=Luteibacter pinisoli TaxID=2589080 RepID=A0A4Y5YZQ0_9GAMM|nr:xylose ABC transporter ATP-binding protein [Luteibacter pinisoli]QDE38284.1 xylose ABC transporter ATP-binding protein [Luteibacter pinisoli]